MLLHVAYIVLLKLKLEYILMDTEKKQRLEEVWGPLFEFCKGFEFHSGSV